MGLLKKLAGLILIFFGLSGIINIIPQLATNLVLDQINPFVILGIIPPTLNDVLLDSVMFFVLLIVGVVLVFHKKDKYKK